LSKWTAGVTATRYGDILRSTDVRVNGVATPTVFDVGNLWVVDAQVAYSFSDKLKLTINGNNIFNEEPGKLPEGSTALWPFQTSSYLNNSPINAAGSFYSATLSYNW
jgi:outer membrane receptor protein involved in Fe transport